MATKLDCALVLGIVLVPACFKPTGWSPERAVRLWKPQASTASGSSAQVMSLDEEQALALALRNSPASSLGRATVAVARAKIGEEQQLKNPEIRLRDVELDKWLDGERMLDIALRVPIPHPWAMDARVKLARAELAGAQAREADVARRLCGRIRKLFARLAMLAQNEADLEGAIQLAEKYAKLTETATRDGVTTKLDGSLTSLRRIQLIDMRHDLRLSRDLVVAELLQLLGLRPDQRIVWRPTHAWLADPPLELEEDALIAQALAERPDLREASARVAAAEADAYVARAERWPWLKMIELGYNVRDDLDPRRFEFALALELPLFSWNRGAVAARDAELAEQRMREQARALAAIQEVHAAAMQVRETTARARELQQSLEPVLAASAEAVQQSASYGAIDARQVMNAEWRRWRAKRRYLQALLERREALIDLEAAVGGSLASRGAEPQRRKDSPR